MLYTTLFQHASVKEVEKLSFRKLSHVGERRDFFWCVLIDVKSASIVLRSSQPHHAGYSFWGKGCPSDDYLIPGHKTITPAAAEDRVGGATGSATFSGRGCDPIPCCIAGCKHTKHGLIAHTEQGNKRNNWLSGYLRSA